MNKFCISQGSEVTFVKCGGQVHNHLCQAASRFHAPKIVKKWMNANNFCYTTPLSFPHKPHPHAWICTKFGTRVGSTTLSRDVTDFWQLVLGCRFCRGHILPFPIDKANGHYHNCWHHCAACHWFIFHWVIQEMVVFLDHSVYGLRLFYLLNKLLVHHRFLFATLCFVTSHLS